MSAGSIAYASTMNSSDALIWNIERDPLLRSNVLSMWFLDSAPHRQRAEASVRELVASVPRLRQRVAEAKPRPKWIDVPRIDFDHHFRYLHLGVRDEVVALAEQWAAEPFADGKPLWQIAVASLADGSGAFLIKVHHTIADGMALVLMLAALVDLERHPGVRTGPRIEATALLDARRQGRRMRTAKFTARRVAAAVQRDPKAAARTAAQATASIARLVMPALRPCSSLMVDRSTDLGLHHRTMPVATLRAAGRSVGGTINDAFVAIVTDAVQRYHHELGHGCDRLRLHMPINIRTERTAEFSGNQFVPARLVMPVMAGAFAPRLSAVRERLAEVRAEPSLRHVNSVSAAIQRLGVGVSRRIIGGMMKGVDVLASNVPGPPLPIFLAGAKVEEFHAFGPPAGAAINVTLFSYDGTASLGITIDRHAVADTARLLACFDAAIADASRFAARWASTVDQATSTTAVA